MSRVMPIHYEAREAIQSELRDEKRVNTQGYEVEDESDGVGWEASQSLFDESTPAIASAHDQFNISSRFGYWFTNISNNFVLGPTRRRVQAQARPDAPVSPADVRRGQARPHRAATRRGYTIYLVIIVSICAVLWALLTSAGPREMHGSTALWADSKQSSHWSVADRVANLSTTGIKPLPCMSHNDESRAIPLFTALSHGCMAVEADIWLRNGELLVGHDADNLRAEDSLLRLYLDPLLQILQGQTGQPHIANRVYEQQQDLSQPFLLMLDFKSRGPDGLDTLRTLEAALTLFREADLLTHYDHQSASVVHRPLVIVASGDVPFDMLTSKHYNVHNDVFFDAPLRWIWETKTGRPQHGRQPGKGQGRAGTSQLDSAAVFDFSNSYLASMSFKSLYWPPLFGLSKQQEAEIKEQIGAAHGKGLKVRYWGTWDMALRPVGRRKLWRELTELGVDITNVDDIEDFAYGSWREAT